MLNDSRSSGPLSGGFVRDGESSIIELPDGSFVGVSPDRTLPRQSPRRSTATSLSPKFGTGVPTALRCLEENFEGDAIASSILAMAERMTPVASGDESDERTW